MLWHKAWLETRWRFISALLILMVLAGGNAVMDELRGYRPASIDVTSVSLKEIFLESVRTED